MHKQHGFTYIEVLVVLGILMVAGSISVPAYRRYQIRNDIDRAATQISQALGRAQLLSQYGKSGYQWGVHVPSGTLYRGTTYAMRNESFDEYYRYPPTITASGLLEVSFSRLQGRPSAQGIITLRSIAGDARTIEILITEHGIVTTQTDRLTVCHVPANPPQTKTIPDNAWPGHQNHGDYLGPCISGVLANYVLGQPSFTSNNNATTQAGMNKPEGVYYDHATRRLFVADTQNRRVTVYDLTTITNGESATNVLGQIDFAASTSGVTQSRTDKNHGVAFDPAQNLLFVADTENSRVLVFDVAAITNGESAVAVLGQASFTSNSTAVTQSRMNKPQGVSFDAAHNRLFVGDTENNRILVFDVAAITNGENAVAVLGQTTFTSNSNGTSASKLKKPTGVAYDALHDRLFVADGENERVLAFDVASITNGENAVNVFGETTFTAANGGVSQSDMEKPEEVWYSGGTDQLFVADTGNHRVLVFDVATITNGENAISVFGQSSFTAHQSGTSQSRLDEPRGVFFDATLRLLFIADTQNSRILLFQL